MIIRLLWWALDLASPSRAAIGEPCRYTLRGAIAGRFDRRFARDGKLTPEDMLALACDGARHEAHALKLARIALSQRQGGK